MKSKHEIDKKLLKEKSCILYSMSRENPDSHYESPVLKIKITKHDSTNKKEIKSKFHKLINFYELLIL